MTVVVLSKCPSGLRGYLRRWLQELPNGVFIGRPTARVRDRLWSEIASNLADGRALMAWTARNENGYLIRMLNSETRPMDFDGLILMMKPSA